MTNLKALHEVEALEERLQTVKWTLLLPPVERKGAVADSKTGVSRNIVSRTAALLGRRFPVGTVYERRVRQGWQKRLRRLEL